jgi:hypothetical protein
MRPESSLRSRFCWKCGVVAISSLTFACALSSGSAKIPPAPIAFRWPDPSFLPERQCRGAYTVEQLDRYVSRARLALWLPGTRAVALDTKRRCLTVTVEAVSDGRLAELLLRGVAVPRRAVLLQLAKHLGRNDRG